MDTHKNACLTPKVERKWFVGCGSRMTKAAAARQFNTTPKTVGKWSTDSSQKRGWFARSILKTSFIASPNPASHVRCRGKLRRERRTQEHIATELGISKASVSRILERRASAALQLEPQEAHPRYERERPGEIIHLDIKKLGRFHSVGHRVTGRRTGYCSSQSAGWEFVHVAIDDHTHECPSPRLSLRWYARFERISEIRGRLAMR